MRLEKYTSEHRNLGQAKRAQGWRERTMLTKPRRADMGSPKTLAVFGVRMGSPKTLAVFGESEAISLFPRLQKRNFRSPRT